MWKGKGWGRRSTPKTENRPQSGPSGTQHLAITSYAFIFTLPTGAHTSIKLLLINKLNELLNSNAYRDVKLQCSLYFTDSLIIVAYDIVIRDCSALFHQQSV